MNKGSSVLGGDKNKVITQNAYVVNDMDEAIEHWATTLGVGPFFTTSLGMDCLYRGQPSHLEIVVSMVQAGTLNIELIQQLNDTPSVYRDIYKPGEEGFHHVSMFTDNFDEELERYKSLGFEVGLFYGTEDTFRLCYIDTFNPMGFMTELVEDKPMSQANYTKVREAAIDWDGTDLVRPLY